MKWWSENQTSLSSQKFPDMLSFEEYTLICEKDLPRHARPANLYLKEMFDHFGQDPKGNFRLFQKEYPDSPAVHGQLQAQQSMYQNLVNFCEEGFINKFILLVGPNGSSKSSLIRKIMMAADEYSRSDEGPLYSFSWIFPMDSLIKGSLGLKPNERSQRNAPSYAHLEDNEISAILASELRDHPLLLIPSEGRKKMIDELLADFPQYHHAVKKSYLYHGDMSKKNRMIYDALLKNYKGSIVEVLKHVRVERFNISRRYSISSVTIEPQLHVDAGLQQVTMDRRLANLPPSLQSLNLFNMQGELVFANRGILEFSDLLKRPLDTFKYLLMTMETKNINIQGILTELDIFFTGSSNEIHLAAFKQHPDFNSFRGRMNFIRVPYLLNESEEEQIYRDQIKNLEGQSKFELHSVEMLCLFAVMTRIRPSVGKNYSDPALAKLSSTLSPLEKVFLISRQQTPERFDSTEKQILVRGIDEICQEYDNDNLYEGKFGISPRELKQIIYELAGKHKVNTFIEVLDYLEKFIERKNEYDFLNLTPQGEYHHPVRFLGLLKDYGLNVLDQEIRDCLGLVDNRSYEAYIEKYILHVSHILKGEKIRNNVTRTYEDPDRYYVQEFETNIGLSEQPNNFRSNLVSILGAYSLDHPGEPIVYTKVFSGLVSKLKESFRTEQKKTIEKINKNLVYYMDQKRSGDTVQETGVSGESGEARELILGLLKNMKERYGYSELGALNLLKYLLKERY